MPKKTLLGVFTDPIVTIDVFRKREGQTRTETEDRLSLNFQLRGGEVFVSAQLGCELNPSIVTIGKLDENCENTIFSTFPETK